MESASPAPAGTLRVDTHLAKFSQASTVVLTALGFLFNQPIIILITAIILAISAFVPAVSPYRLVYRGIVLPLHLVRPRIVEDDPMPHRFAQGIGAAFLVASALVLFFTHPKTFGLWLELIGFVLLTLY